MSEDPSTAARPPVVYLVAHDPVLRDRLCRLFSAVGLDCRSFDSAERLLSSLDPSRPGCLVTEVELPAVGGLDLLRRLRERKLDLPAIILARQGEVGQAVQAMRLGAVDFLEKPFVDRVLLRRVFESLGIEARREPASLVSRG